MFSRDSFVIEILSYGCDCDWSIADRHTVIDQDKLVGGRSAFVLLLHSIDCLLAVIAEIALVVELEQEAANGDDIKLAVIGD